MNHVWIIKLEMSKLATIIHGMLQEYPNNHNLIFL